MLTRSAEKRNKSLDQKVISWRDLHTEFQKSICNLVIHVPECDIANVHLVLPKIKSLHFHFKKGRKNRRLILGEDNEGCSLLQKPESNLNEKIFLESDNRQILRSPCREDEGEALEGTDSERNLRNKIKHNHCRICLNSKTNKKVNNKSCKGSKHNSYHMLLESDKKLTTAVVVLKDILRLNNKVGVKAKECLQNSEKEDKDVAVIVKQEVSESSNKMTTINPTSNSTEGRVVEKPSGGVNITKLAEGCSFSEILNRFRLEHKDHATDFNCSSYDSAKEDEVNLEENENFSQEKVVVSENNELNFETSDLDRQALEKRDGLPIPHVKEEIEDYDIHQNVIHDDLVQEMESLTDQDFVEADDSESTTAVQSSLGKGNEETVGSSSLTPEVEIQCSDVPEVCSDVLGNTKVLITDKEKMKSKIPLKTNENKNKKPEKRSLRKSGQANNLKMSESNEKSKKRRSKRQIAVASNYIPLDAAGPTKFGVAMVNNIKPFMEHRANDFRSKMLFGDRVKRYPSSTCLRTYKLKQEAVRHVKK